MNESEVEAIPASEVADIGLLFPTSHTLINPVDQLQRGQLTVRIAWSYILII